jgi:membrane protease YdiL (CAAX protease family)
LAGGIGLYLGAVWLATGNLLVPITSHALYDFLAFVYLVQVRKSKAASESAENKPED